MWFSCTKTGGMLNWRSLTSLSLLLLKKQNEDPLFFLASPRCVSFGAQIFLSNRRGNSMVSAAPPCLLVWQRVWLLAFVCGCFVWRCFFGLLTLNSSPPQATHICLCAIYLPSWQPATAHNSTNTYSTIVLSSPSLPHLTPLLKPLLLKLPRGWK